MAYPFKAPSNGLRPKNTHSNSGNTTKKTNDGQWENQKKLYTVEEGIYLAPRAHVATANQTRQMSRAADDADHPRQRRRRAAAPLRRAIGIGGWRPHVALRIDDRYRRQRGRQWAG